MVFTIHNFWNIFVPTSEFFVGIRSKDIKYKKDIYDTD